MKEMYSNSYSANFGALIVSDRLYLAYKDTANCIIIKKYIYLITLLMLKFL